MSALFAAYEPDPEERPPAFEGLVRRAEPGDAEAITRIGVQRNGGSPEETLARIRDELAGPDDARSALFVAVDDGEVIAFARARHAADFSDVEESLRPPAGWYLLGVVVAPPHRRRGVARALTRARLDWLAPRTDECFYFVRATNRASIDLHAPFGFVEHTRRFLFPRTGLEAGAGVLFRLGGLAAR